MFCELELWVGAIILSSEKCNVSIAIYWLRHRVPLLSLWKTVQKAFEDVLN
jgi:hypothetical protein